MARWRLPISVLIGLSIRTATSLITINALLLSGQKLHRFTADITTALSSACGEQPTAAYVRDSRESVRASASSIGDLNSTTNIEGSFVIAGTVYAMSQKLCESIKLHISVTAD